MPTPEWREQANTEWGVLTLRGEMDSRIRWRWDAANSRLTGRIGRRSYRVELTEAGVRAGLGVAYAARRVAVGLRLQVAR